MNCEVATLAPLITSPVIVITNYLSFNSSYKGRSYKARRCSRNLPVCP